MLPHDSASHPRLAATIVAMALLTGVAVGAPAAAAQSPGPEQPETGVPTSAPWSWPVAGARIARAYEAPAHEYGAGHRGIDLRPTGDERVRAPRAGVIAFSGRIADRGILTIDHGDGYVTTLEPIDSDVAVGTRVDERQIVGTMATGGHAESGTIHFGVRLDGIYVNPLLLLGGVPRAVLLPCCS